jgi:hypothetical protein
MIQAPLQPANASAPPYYEPADGFPYIDAISEQTRLAFKHIASFLNRLTIEEAQRHYERYIRRISPPTVG